MLEDGGFGDLEGNEIVEMRDHGVDGAYLRKLKDTGFQTLSAAKIIKLRTHGVD